MRGQVVDKTAIAAVILSKLAVVLVKSSCRMGPAPCLTRRSSPISTLHMVDHRI